MRFALSLEYDGRSFFGWQSQAGGNTVQDAVELALSQVAATPVRVVCAGRTDTGVHAAAQVVHFDTGVERPLSAWVRGTNAHLPSGVAVTGAQQVADDFHARFSATGRHYRYLLLNRPQRPALLAGRAGWHHRPLDIGRMQAAAVCLVGEHDFSAFRAAECQARSPVRTLHSLVISQRKDVIAFDLHANAFLHHMVRNLIGALVYVGDGRKPETWLADLLQERDRRTAAPTFAPDGLYLTGVDYDPLWNINLPKVGAGGTAIWL